MREFLGVVINILLLVGLFGLTIFIHELGHFLAAIWSGMVVDVFSIGFGPAIWKKKVRGVTIKIAWIPFGGYVSIPQLDPAGMAAIQETTGEKQLVDLPKVAVWKKILVALAGATGNVLLAILFAWIIYWHPGVVTEEGNTVVGSVETNAPAYLAGIRPGDEILAVNGERVRTWTEYAVLCAFGGGREGHVSLEYVSPDGITNTAVVATVKSEMEHQMIEGVEKSSVCAVGGVQEGSPAEQCGIQPGDIIRYFDGQLVRHPEHLVSMVKSRLEMPSPIVVERLGKPITLEIVPGYNPEYKRVMIGIEFAQVRGWSWMQYKRPWLQIRNDASQIFRILKALTNPKEAKVAAGGLGGPPMILVTLWLTINGGLLNAIGFIRFLNINLAILNLLPIPVLDGGHIVFAVWEGITRRRPPPKLVNALINVFMVLLLGAILLLSFSDIFSKIPKLLKIRREAVESVERHDQVQPKDEQKDEE